MFAAHLTMKLLWTAYSVELIGIRSQSGKYILPVFDHIFVIGIRMESLSLKRVCSFQHLQYFHFRDATVVTQMTIRNPCYVSGNDSTSRGLQPIVGAQPCEDFL